MSKEIACYFFGLKMIEDYKKKLKNKILKKIKETNKNSEYGWSYISKKEILELLK